MINLSDRDTRALHQLTDVIRWYAPPEKYKIYLFGSRVRGEARDNSDYAIALEGERKISWHDRMMILSAWEGLPYRADLVDLHEVDPRFREEIKKSVIEL